jgi:hypothetical protein
MGIAGHRHRGPCRRHLQYGILYLSLVLEHSGTGLGPLIPVPDWFRHQNFFHSGIGLTGCRTVRHLKSCCCWWWKGCPVQTQTAEVESDTSCTSIDSCWWCNSCYMILKNHIKMPECRRKVRSASAFLPIVSCVSPASAFRPQGSVWYHWSRIIPALPSYVDGYLAALWWMSMTVNPQL